MKKLYHIGLTENPGSKYAILTGDPSRVEAIAQHLENPKFLASNREFTTYCGSLEGKRVIVSSTGIGGASAAITVEELYMAGVRNFIRVGTCGGMHDEVIGGDIIIATAAVRAEGTSREYAPIEYPAVASFDVVMALSAAAKAKRIIHHIGVVQSKDSFYGQHEPSRMPVSDELSQKWQAWIKCGCLASEMECAAIFTVCNILRARCGAVLSVVWNQEREKKNLSNPHSFNMTNSIKTAVEAMKILIESDKTL